MARGWFDMPCWNGLSEAQQQRLIKVGNLPIFSVAEGDCPNGAEIGIETQTDEAPGPRFYCPECAAKYTASFLADYITDGKTAE